MKKLILRYLLRPLWHRLCRSWRRLPIGIKERRRMNLALTTCWAGRSHQCAVGHRDRSRSNVLTTRFRIPDRRSHSCSVRKVCAKRCSSGLRNSYAGSIRPGRDAGISHRHGREDRYDIGRATVGGLKVDLTALMADGARYTDIGSRSKLLVPSQHDGLLLANGISGGGMAGHGISGGGLSASGISGGGLSINGISGGGRPLTASAAVALSINGISGGGLAITGSVAVAWPLTASVAVAWPYGISGGGTQSASAASVAVAGTSGISGGGWPSAASVAVASSHQRDQWRRLSQWPQWRWLCGYGISGGGLHNGISGGGWRSRHQWRWHSVGLSTSGISGGGMAAHGISGGGLSTNGISGGGLLDHGISGGGVWHQWRWALDQWHQRRWHGRSRHQWRWPLH